MRLVFIQVLLSGCPKGRPVPTELNSLSFTLRENVQSCFIFRRLAVLRRLHEGRDSVFLIESTIISTKKGTKFFFVDYMAY